MAIGLVLLLSSVASAAPADRPPGSASKPNRPGTPPAAESFSAVKFKGRDAVPNLPLGSVGATLDLGATSGGPVQPASTALLGTTALKANTAPLLAAAAPAAASKRALIVYDSTGPYAWLGQAYATMATNLVSHFAAWTAKPVAQYTAGELATYDAAIYVGSTYDEPLPNAWLDDVASSAKPVIWMYDNIWRLQSRIDAQGQTTFQAKYGWMWRQFDTSYVGEVDYKSASGNDPANPGLSRDPQNGAGIMDYVTTDPSTYSDLAAALQARGGGILAWARRRCVTPAQPQPACDPSRGDGSRFPWAVRSGNLTYIGEVPFAYFNESDRRMVFEDLLFDALGSGAPAPRRALLRLEDISPGYDAQELAQLRADADYLSSKGIPFGFGVSPQYTDPLGTYNGGQPETVRLRQAADVVNTLKYLQSKGGMMIEHGWTHQYSNIRNPYTGVTGDDFEFYRATEDPITHTLTFVGPVPNDSANYADSRLSGAARDFSQAGFATPTIFEFPHYMGSGTDYRRVARQFSTRWERSLYALGSLAGGTLDETRVVGQIYPYAVRDVFGSKVLPESLGNVEPQPFFQYPERLPAAIIRDAKRLQVVRDGVAGLYFHPFFDLSYLKQTVEGIQALGYTFVGPATL
jgi:uncharacterized protein YdaL